MDAQPTRQRTLLRRLWEASPAKVYHRLRRLARPAPRPVPPTAPAPAPALGRPPRPPAHPPRKLLFLSDCHLATATWSPFHRTVLGYLSCAVESVLAVRANAFFVRWSDGPYSQAHLDHLRRAVREYEPDLVFSTNRAGLHPALLDALHPDVKVVTLFIDYYEYVQPGLRRFGPRDRVWMTTLGGAREAFLAAHKETLRPEQVCFLPWGVDHHLFAPRAAARGQDLVFVGTVGAPSDCINLFTMLAPYPGHRERLLGVWEDHRRQYVYDFPAALRARGFDFDSLPPDLRDFLQDNRRVHLALCEQTSVENRVGFLSALCDFNIALYGEPVERWVHAISLVNSRLFQRYQFRGIADPAELAEVYNRSRIGVNVQIDQARGHGLSFRVFDLMACKALLMTHADSQQALDETGFAEGRDYACFRTAAELREKCAFYLAHEGRRAAVVESAYERVRRGHTLAHRFAEAFGRLGFPEPAAAFARLCPGAPGGLAASLALDPARVTTVSALPS